MKTRSIFIIIAAIILSSNSGSVQMDFIMDKNHAKLGFSVKHFGISNVEGNFKSFETDFKSSKDDFSDAVIIMTADASSIDTDIEMRDKDLRSSNWLDVEKYPKIVFKSSSFEKITMNEYILKGFITIHGITKPISFDVVYNGKMLNPMTKKNSIGFTVKGNLNRKDFKVGSGPSSMAVSAEVELSANVEFIESEALGRK